MTQSKEFRTNHLMWTMGDDFAYEYANTWFKQMDKLIHYVNLDGRVNALYSTPSIYLDAKYAANETWPLKTGDFFP
jgi:alpha-mannosidase